MHATFGVAAYDLDTQADGVWTQRRAVVHAGIDDEAAHDGTALGLLGADYRFQTPVYRTGPIVGGVVKGDLVIVASGDPNLSGRILGDTLGFSNEDHSYAGRGDSVARAIGDPLLVMREFAAQIAAKGIKQIDGRILVDRQPVSARRSRAWHGCRHLADRRQRQCRGSADQSGRKGRRSGHSPSVAGPRHIQDCERGCHRSAAVHVRAPPTMARDSATGSVTVRVSGTYAVGAAPSVMDIVVDDPAELAIRGLTAALRDRGISVRDAGRRRERVPTLAGSPRATATRRGWPSTSRCRCRKRSR